MATKKFRMYIDPQEFLNEVYAPSELERLVKQVNAIISPRDIVRLCDTGYCGVQLMSIDVMEGILRSVKDGRGREVYLGAEIMVGRITPSLAYAQQSFVQANKLLGFPELSSFLAKYGINGIKELGPLIIKYAGKEGGEGESYLAFYFPPILEEADSSELEPILKNLQRRLERERYIKLPAYRGEGAVDLEEIYRINKREFQKRNSISYLKDGTHRAYLISIAGTTTKVIRIKGGETYPAAALIPINKLVITSEKPKRKEDRFLGLREDAWLNYKAVGIDG